MRTLGICLALTLCAHAGPTEAVSPEDAKAAILEFEQAFKAKELEAKQNAVYDLHDVPSDLVIKRLGRLLRHKNPEVRNVAALALGGQAHNPEKAGALFMKVYVKDFKTEVVISSVLDGMTELGYLKYWPRLEAALKDERNAIIIRVLELLGSNKDWRAVPKLLEIYKIVMPKRVSWQTGEEKVDTGAAGDADQKAAEAAFNAKYGRGGSKAKAKAKGFDLRNFSTQIRRCVRRVTGQDFDTAMDFEDWYVENYLMVARAAAEMDGRSVEKAVARAEKELPELKKKVEEARKKLEEELAKQREQKAK